MSGLRILASPLGVYPPRGALGGLVSRDTALNLHVVTIYDRIAMLSRDI
jgi:hypothetical protein